MSQNVKRIAVIGNGGGGKTTLSTKLSRNLQIPVTHVDSIQFLPQLKKRPIEETREILNRVADEESWIIDGFGPLDVIERRFELADKIIFIDFPLWRHFWWATKRQINSFKNKPRGELPRDCNEATLSHTIDLYKTLWRVHQELRPQFLHLFATPEYRGKVVKITDLSQWFFLFERKDGYVAVQGL